MNCDPEVTLLTECFFNTTTIEEAAMVLQPADFKSAECRMVFELMKALAEEGKPVDFVFLYDKLREKLSHEDAVNLICRISEGQPVVGRTRDYALKILENAKKRRFSGLLTTAHSRAEQLEDPAQIIRDTAELYQDIQAERVRGDIVRLDEVTMDVLNELAALRNGDQSALGIQTGIEQLDLATKGIGKGEFWIVGAMPGRGKTLFGTQVAMNAVTRGISVFYVSLEMNLKEINKRILSNECGVGIVRSPQFSSNEKFSALMEVAAGFNGLPFYADESSTLTSTDLVLRCRRAIRKHDIKLIVVDYMQLIVGRGRELRERVGDAGNSLRQLAKDTGVPVLALSQLNRPDKGINEIPTMIRLKESGDLEAHAHTILLLHTPIGDDQGHTGEDEIIIGKHRNGSVGTIPVFLDRRHLLFRSRDVTK